MGYRTIIGLEIHAELLTQSKIFCDCTTEFGGDPNTHCCPICLGLPGTLPVINKKVVEFGIRAGLAFDCRISNKTKMDRKNYFYPDLVKGYQISQYDMPLCKEGYIEINRGRVTGDRGLEKENGGQEEKKKIRIRRIHIEEDTGKSIHSEDGGTLLDYNRSGVPLIEIVTEPDMSSPDEAKDFLEKLKAILQYIEVSDCKMEEGSLRADININVIDEETEARTAITELKNLNSFKAAVKAMEYEEERHKNALREGKDITRETRRWDDVNNETIVMRIKEEVSDYRYFSEPDLVEMEIDDRWIKDIKGKLPELPHNKKERFIKEYNIPEYDAGVLISSKALAQYYEETVRLGADPKLTSNWIMGDILRRLKDEDMKIEHIRFMPKNLSNLIILIEKGTISNNIGKKVLRIMFEKGSDPNLIIEEEGLTQINNEDKIREIIQHVLNQNQQSVEDYRNGKGKALGYLVGQIMKTSRGKANPQMVNTMLLGILNKK